MSKNLKETLMMIICILNISTAVLGFYFVFNDMPMQAIITTILFVLTQPLSHNLMNKLS